MKRLAFQVERGWEIFQKQIHAQTRRRVLANAKYKNVYYGCNSEMCRQWAYIRPVHVGAQYIEKLYTEIIG